MDQIKQLWDFQSEDIKADRLANEINNNQLRKQLDQDSTLYSNCMAQYKKIEEQIASLTDRKDAIQDALNRCKDQLSNLQARYDSAPPANLDAVRAFMADVDRCLETIADYENELKTICANVRTADQNASKLRAEGMRLKKEFQQLKAEYEQALPAMKAARDAQRAVAESKKEGIPAELLAAYAEIKKHVAPPVAKLDDRGQCSGCHTALSSATRQRIRNSGGEIVKCENCGRMLVRF